jgi:hypothetical protein
MEQEMSWRLLSEDHRLKPPEENHLKPINRFRLKTRATLRNSRTAIDGYSEALMSQWMVTVLPEEKLLKNKDDLSGCYSWMVGELITHIRYDGH